MLVSLGVRTAAVDATRRVGTTAAADPQCRFQSGGTAFEEKNSGPGRLLGQGGWLDSSYPGARGYTGHLIGSSIFTPDGSNNAALPWGEWRSAPRPRWRKEDIWQPPRFRLELKAFVSLFRLFGEFLSYCCACQDELPVISCELNRVEARRENCVLGT